MTATMEEQKTRTANGGRMTPEEARALVDAGPETPDDEVRRRFDEAIGQADGVRRTVLVAAQRIALGPEPAAAGPEPVPEVVKLGLYTPWTDTGNAEILAAVFGDGLRYDHARDRWLIWDRHHWRPDEDGHIIRVAVEAVRGVRLKACEYLESELQPVDTDALPESLARMIDGLRKLSRDLKAAARDYESKARLDAMTRLARAQSAIADTGRGWDEAIGIVGASNGVIDLRTGELRPGAPEDRITMQLGVEYDPAAECPRWERFVRQVLDEDDAVVTYAQRVLGSALGGSAPAVQVFWLLKGPGGNGKGALVRALKTVLGDYAYELPAAALMASNRNAHTTDIAQMEGKRLVVCTELGSYDDVNADRVKQLVGGDHVNARRLYQDGRQIPPSWLLVLSTNTDPKPDDNSAGWWRRNRVIPMPRQFSPDDEPGLEATLRAEAPGILRWLVEGAREYYRDETEGTVPVEVAESGEELREDTDPLAKFFDAETGFLTRARGYWTPVATIWTVYERWAAESRVPEGFRFRSDKSLAKKLGDQYGRKRIEVNTAEGWRKLSGLFDVRIAPRYPEGEQVWEAKRGPLAP